LLSPLCFVSLLGGFFRDCTEVLRYDSFNGCGVLKKWVPFNNPKNLRKRKVSQGLNLVSRMVAPAWQCYFWPKIPGCSKHCEQKHCDGTAITHSQIFRDDPPHSHYSCPIFFCYHQNSKAIDDHCELFPSQAGYFHWFCLLTASRSWNQLQHPLFFLGTSCASPTPEILKLYHSTNFLKQLESFSRCFPKLNKKFQVYLLFRVHLSTTKQKSQFLQ